MPAPEGYTSLGVIGYTDKGTYAAGTTYNKFNVVLYNGSSYVAVKDGLTGVTPANDGVNWRLFANGFPDNGVTTDNFQATLENYLDQTESTATNKAPSSAYLKEIKDGLDNDIGELTSSMIISREISLNGITVEADKRYTKWYNFPSVPGYTAIGFFVLSGSPYLIPYTNDSGVGTSGITVVLKNIDSVAPQSTSNDSKVQVIMMKSDLVSF